MNSARAILLHAILLLVFAFPALPQSPPNDSVLKDGPWLKLGIKKDGVYKIDFDLLRKLGITPSSIDPDNIRLFGNPGGMLPQANDAYRPTGLMEIPLLITGASDGKFDRGDLIFFYAEGPTLTRWNNARQSFEYQNNLYSELNFCFLTVSSQPGARIGVSEDQNASAPAITTFRDYAVHETDRHNDQHSGREWYGEKFGVENEMDFEFDISDVHPGSDIRVVSDVMAQSYAPASFRILLNGTQIGEQSLLPITNSRYSIKGYDRRDTLDVSAATVGATGLDKQVIQYRFQKASGFSQAYLDFVLVNFTRTLKLFGDQTIFTCPESLLQPVSDFKVAGAAGARIWDITHFSDVREQAFREVSGDAVFSTNTTELKRFIVFNDDAMSPVSSEKIDNQHLHGLGPANLIIITHPLFVEEAERLAAHREGDGWNVHVVTTTQVYHEFSSGRQDVVALRDFIKHIYDQDPAALKAVLMFGRGSYDYKDRLSNNTNFVATYESRNSLHPLQTYSSDDFFGFLEDAEGEWQESPARNHTLDVGVGRLPVTTVEEARSVVDKIIRYETGPESTGYWRKKLVFVADDGNGDDGFTSLHQSHANSLAIRVEELNAGFDARKLFMGVYPKTIRPNGETAEKMTEDLKRAFDDGALIINFTGHGSERLWTDERIFSDFILGDLENERYPFLVTATCEFGRQDDPTQLSTAEQSVTRPNGGAIGLVTTARPVNATTNSILNHAFYDALLTRDEESYRCLADVFRMTKNNSLSGVANRNFSLLGDPSMTLGMPRNLAVVTSVETSTGSDTLKALSTVTIRGEVQNAAGVRLENYNGVAEAILFDKESNLKTIGRNNPPFEFKEWNNNLFHGQARITGGSFEFSFILPKNISYTVGTGRLSLYASSTSDADANGATYDFKVGGTEPGIAGDVTPPAIQLFIGDTTFIDGGIASPDTDLIVQLSDESGINISDYGIGNTLVAELDGGETFVLSAYYTCDVDTYKKGTVIFPLRDLEAGPHRLVVKAWDVFNNPAQAAIDFVVSPGDGIVIESFGNFPNPFTETTTLFFTHNRSGEDLDASLYIYSAAGNLYKSVDIPIQGSSYRIELAELDNRAGGNKKLPPGLYLARLVVRSRSDGSKNEQLTKLIVLN